MLAKKLLPASTPGKIAEFPTLRAMVRMRSFVRAKATPYVHELALPMT